MTAAPPSLEIHLEAKTWNELTKVQCIQTFTLLTEGSTVMGHLPMLSMVQRLRAFFYLADLPAHIIEEWQLSDSLSAEDALDSETIFACSLHEACTQVLAPLIKIGTEEGEPPFSLIFERTKAIWPELKVRTAQNRTESWYAPATAWENLSIYEMAMAFSLLETFGSDPQPEHIHRLMATLYRPSKPATPLNLDTNYQNDRRIPYLEHGEYNVDRRMPHFAKLSPAVLNLLLFWAMSCRASIIAAYPRVFVPRKESTADRNPNDYGWGGVLLSIAEGVVNLDKVAAQNCHTILAYLSKLEDERLDQAMWG